MTEDASSSLEQAKTQLSELAADEKGLDTKLAKKRTELERNEKRLRSLKTVRPAFMDEYEMVERELQQRYQEYLVRFRNVQYLENELRMLEKGEAEEGDAGREGVAARASAPQDGPGGRGNNEQVELAKDDQQEERVDAVPRRALAMGEDRMPETIRGGGD